MNTTTENNKLLAEFLNMTESTIPNKFYTLTDKDGFGIGELVELQFHKDWDWLMQVVEKIESIKDNQGCSFFVEISKEKVHIKYYYKGEEFSNLFCFYFNRKSKIETIHNACVEFVKWYNSAQENKLN